MLGTILIFNKLPRMAVGILLSALVLVACGGEGAEDEERMRIVATTSIAGDLVTRIAGNDAEVVVLMPVGSDPHDFRPSSQQVAELRSADLVVAWGLGLEEGLADVLEAAESDGVRVLELSARLDPIEFSAPAEDDHATGDEDHSEDEDHAEDEHDHALDPHTWTDPVRMAQAARLIGSALAEVAPDGDWPARAEALAAEMLEVHDQVTAILSTIPDERRKLVTNHDSLGYFAERYGFEIVGIAIPGGSTLTSPSSAQIAELVHAIEEAGLTVVFAESTSSPALLEAAAAEVGDVTVVELLEGSLAPPGQPGDTVAGMLVHNARLIAEALG
ncbi:MAG: metal ABC transporter substrate-binding protein [Acidimicrobiia bacterium]|nr:metal ABC transporter substrate-binding protein [Acidimicrobiia bacterium]